MTTTTVSTTTTTEPTTTIEPRTVIIEPTTTTTEPTITTTESTPVTIGDIILSAAVTPGLEERIGSPPYINTSDDFNIYEIIFECDLAFINGSVEPRQFIYDISWYINNVKLPMDSGSNLTYINITTTGRLREENWKDIYTLGFEVKCGVALRSSDNNIPSDILFSDSFYAGIQTDFPEYTVTEGDWFDIRVTLTVPLGCYFPSNSSINEINNIKENHCKLMVGIITSMESSGSHCSAGGLTNEPIVFGDISCGLQFSHSNWQSAQVVRVYGTSDNIVNVLDREVEVRFKAEETVTRHTTWNSASSQNISVTVVDADSRIVNSVCKSYNDPHLSTFDGRNWDNQRLGEFVLYYNTEAGYAVHAMYQACVNGVSGATCNCGLAIKSNKALFVANFCSARIGWSVSDGVSSNRYIEGSICDNTDMVIENDDNSYQVTLPTGTQISFYHIIDVNTTTIGGITIKPSLADWQTSSGLCGYMDGNKTNDFRIRDGGTTSDERTFALDWKITGNTSLASLFGDVNLSDINTTSHRYCKCRDRTVKGVNAEDCNLHSTNTLCTSSGSSSFFQSCNEGLRRKRSISEPSHRRRRAVADGDAVAKFPIVQDSDADQEPTPLSWRNGWNEDLATEACRQFLQNQMFLQKCEEIIDEMKGETAIGIDSCVQDIKLIGDNRFMQSTADTLSESCRLTAVRLENLTMTSSSASTGKTVLDEMLDLHCRNNCSGNGRCTNGRCECFDDFEGGSCSIRRSLPPMVSSKTNPGLCQSDVYACTTFYISGSNFASENVTCRTVHFAISESTHELTSQNQTFPAVPIPGGIGCSCSLPQSRRRKRSVNNNNAIASGFFLSVSNDGVRFSDDIVVIVYNSTCLSCNTTGITCSVKSSCESTYPTTEGGSITTTSATGHDSPQNGYMNIGLVAGVTIGGIGVVVVLLVLTKLVLTQRKSEKKSHPSPEDEEEEEYRYRRNFYWEQGRGYPSLGRSSTSNRIHTRFY
ncbi:von Willebrand factor D and EGF domain-containing protein-like [Argopecten irradians]|uniref:von Willebrand factor D and EGF domain-containing protein-like n=1 Tax=Argopecten irradians TaxID=31199 RepID=UPI0037196E8B